jgi:hypothetical protein
VHISPVPCTSWLFRLSEALDTQPLFQSWVFTPEDKTEVIERISASGYAPICSSCTHIHVCYVCKRNVCVSSKLCPPALFRNDGDAPEKEVVHLSLRGQGTLLPDPKKEHAW